MHFSSEQTKKHHKWNYKINMNAHVERIREGLENHHNKTGQELVLKCASESWLQLYAY